MLKRFVIGTIIAIALVVSVAPADAFEYCPWWLECLDLC
jgi:hypothetical protein